jgi:starch phosphorylase
MAHLATVGSHRVNGVAALHSDLVRTRLLADFATIYPGRFINQTNGVTPRRWVLAANPELANLLDREVGPSWPMDGGAWRNLEPRLNDRTVLDELAAIKLQNKRRLARLIFERTQIQVDPTALFDVQIKRIHEYKRQLLCALYVIARWLRIKSGEDLPPRVVVFAGKAAPGYATAKLHIRFIHDVARLIARDGDCKHRLQVVFVPNYGVSSAEVLIPAADLSEQISLAGKEASGTGNMKLAMNGALTIGTLDGANIEIRDAVGAENFFLFGHTAEQVEGLRNQGYRPREYIARDPVLSEVLALIATGLFAEGDPHRYRNLVASLRDTDTWMLCADFADYVRAHDEVDRLWADPAAWTYRAGLNIARTGWFSSDRTIRGYAADIWGAEPVPVDP